MPWGTCARDALPVLAYVCAQAYVGVLVSAWSYNALIAAWEPILEPWDLILKADLNTSPMAMLSLPALPLCCAISAMKKLEDKNAVAGLLSAAWRVLCQLCKERA